MDRPANPRLSDPVLPFLLCLFVGSGCSALIYEIVWFQMLELMIGSTTISLGVLLATFMGGLCLGSLALSRFVSARRNPLLVYALLELGIGVFAIAVYFAMPYVGEVYAAVVGRGTAGMLLRGAISAALLLPPTVLMGATLPAISRWIETTPRGVSWMGLLYASNIIGGVFGCLLAGFYLLRVYDVAIATYVAAAINCALALLAIALAAAASYRAPAPQSVAGRAVSGPEIWAVYLVIGLSGLTALGAQVIWTRMLALLLGNAVYTFSIILAVFLFGLGIGSSAGSFLARSIARPRLALGVSQLLLVATIAWAALTINAALPYWPVNPRLASSLASSPWYGFQLDLVRCILAILPAACLWGASFPLALAAAASPGQDPGRMVGAVYAANTVGAIIGSLAFSIVLIPTVGVYVSHLLLIGLCVAAGLAMLATLMPFWKGRAVKRETRLSAATSVGTVAVSLVLGGLLAWAVPPVPPVFVALGRTLLQWNSLPTVLYTGEGINSWVSVVEWEDGYRVFHSSGTGLATNYPQDMHLQLMLGHIATLTTAKPRSVLIIGHGAGITAGSFIPYPEIERIVVCEIEPLIPPNVGPFFAKENNNLLKDPRVEVIYDDGRHFLFTTKEKFDIITTDPLQPWAKGAATLYTREFFQRAKELLNPGGTITQYVQLFDSSLEAVKSEVATFFQVFPEGALWSNEVEEVGSDMVMYGQKDPAPIDLDKIQQRLNRPDYARVVETLGVAEFRSAIDLFATYAGRAADLKPWLADAQINTDRNLRLQYLAGLSANESAESAIYENMVQHWKFPDDLFVASDETKQKLRTAMERRR